MVEIQCHVCREVAKGQTTKADLRACLADQGWVQLTPTGKKSKVDVCGMCVAEHTLR